MPTKQADQYSFALSLTRSRDRLLQVFMSSLCGYRKCLSWRTSRRVVQLLLVAWFLAQCVVSLNKLLERDVGTAESSDHEENPAYPSLTLCPLSSSYDPSVNDGRTLDEAYESLIPIANRLVFLEQENFSDRCAADTGDRCVLMLSQESPFAARMCT